MIRFALFGAGRAGAIHARNIARHPRAELVCICDVDRPAADPFGQGARRPARSPTRRRSGPRTRSTPVLIASSTNTHVDLLREALGAGKPTYCEKPIDFDLARVRAVRHRSGRDRRPRRGRVPAPRPPRVPGDPRGGSGKEKSGRSKSSTSSRATTGRPRPSTSRSPGGSSATRPSTTSTSSPGWSANGRPRSTPRARVSSSRGSARRATSTPRWCSSGWPSGALCHIDNGRRAVYGFDERVEVFGERGMLQSLPPSVSNVARFGAAGIRHERYPDLYGEESFAGLLDSFVTALESGQPARAFPRRGPPGPAHRGGRRRIAPPQPPGCDRVLTLRRHRPPPAAAHGRCRPGTPAARGRTSRGSGFPPGSRRGGSARPSCRRRGERSGCARSTGEGPARRRSGPRSRARRSRAGQAPTGSK